MSTTRKQWVAMLAKLVAPMAAVAAGKAMGDMLPLLADLPDAAFTLASLEHVASQCHRVPTYGELRSCLGNWWLANRPPQPAIAHPVNHWERHDLPKPRDPPTEAEKAYVGEIVSALRLEMAARQVSAAIASVKPLRPAVVMTDRQLLATLEAQGAGSGHRATMLRAKLEKELTP